VLTPSHPPGCVGAAGPVCVCRSGIVAEARAASRDPGSVLLPAPAQWVCTSRLSHPSLRVLGCEGEPELLHRVGWKVPEGTGVLVSLTCSGCEVAVALTLLPAVKEQETRGERQARAVRTSPSWGLS